jgi:anion-transporting  ArsA/GET3 family ATPase
VQSLAPIIFITGKGGVGKTHVATALAGRARRRGLVTGVVHATFSELGATPSARDAELGRRMPSWPEALEALVRATVPLGFLAARLLASRSFAAVAEAAPGLKDVAMLSAIADMAARRRGLDLLVVDAPASGTAASLLSAPEAVAELTPVGAMARRARELATLVADPARFAIVAVSLPERLPVLETAELVTALATAGHSARALVANAMWPELLDLAGRRWLAEHGGSEDARLYRRRMQRQRTELGHLRALDLPCHEWPWRPSDPRTPDTTDEEAERLLESLLGGSL